VLQVLLDWGLRVGVWVRGGVVEGHGDPGEPAGGEPDAAGLQAEAEGLILGGRSRLDPLA